MQIGCPSCERMLKVPDGAVGRRARCPACEHKFVVADPRDALEETISGWIMTDTQQMEELRERNASISSELQRE